MICCFVVFVVLFVLLFSVYSVYSVYTYKQQQTPKILFSLFFIFFFCFFSLFLCFLFFLSFADPQDYYTPVYAKIRPIFFPSFSTFFLRPVYELKHIAQIIITVFVGIVREPLFKKSDSRALSKNFSILIIFCALMLCLFYLFRAGDS